MVLPEDTDDTEDMYVAQIHGHCIDHRLSNNARNISDRLCDSILLHELESAQSTNDYHL